MAGERQEAHPELFTISDQLVDALRCPESKQKLRWATAEELAKFPDAPSSGLIREDGTVLYPVRDGFPVLLTSEALRVSEP